jgi:antiphage defense system Thoeris ThsB-like protein
MARQVFFSFHHQRDIWRANQVRNSWVTKDRGASGFWDAAEWEEVKKKDTASIHKWIDKQMEGTSVTAVLIGTETSTRDHVGYEITQSHKLGKGIVGIRIHSLKNKDGNTDYMGNNPLDLWKITENGFDKLFSSIYKTYDYVGDSGYNNLGSWVEAAAKAAGR